jgi:hypothetical protein
VLLHLSVALVLGVLVVQNWQRLRLASRSALPLDFGRGFAAACSIIHGDVASQFVNAVVRCPWRRRSLLNISCKSASRNLAILDAINALHDILSPFDALQVRIQHPILDLAQNCQMLRTHMLRIDARSLRGAEKV